MKKTANKQNNKINKLMKSKKKKSQSTLNKMKMQSRRFFKKWDDHQKAIGQPVQDPWQDPEYVKQMEHLARFFDFCQRERIF